MKLERAQQWVSQSIIWAGHQWRARWAVRWVFANIVGWGLGLLLAALAMQMLGLVGAVLSGAVAGTVAGGAQALMLRTYPQAALDARAWWAWSVMGGLAGTMPLFLLGWLGVFPLGLALLGALFGGLFGLAQHYGLRHQAGPPAILWVGFCTIAGCACAPLTFSTSGWLPVIFAPGPIVYGLITAWGLHNLLPPREASAPADPPGH